MGGPMQLLLEGPLREALHARLVSTHPAEDTVYLPELGLCQHQARINLAVVNGELTGWEIKSGADSLSRLSAQIPVYSAVFDRVWLAAHERHVEAATKLVPSWWGLVEMVETRRGCAITEVRAAGENPAIDVLSLSRLLWRDDLVDILRTIGAADSLRRAPRRDLWSALAAAVPDTLSRDNLRRTVREVLKSRYAGRSLR